MSSGLVGLTRMWMRLVGPVPLSVSPMIQRVAGRDRPGADELFAFLQGNVGHLPRHGVDLIERSWRKRANG